MRRRKRGNVGRKTLHVWCPHDVVRVTSGLQARIRGRTSIIYILYTHRIYMAHGTPLRPFWIYDFARSGIGGDGGRRNCRVLRIRMAYSIPTSSQAKSEKRMYHMSARTLGVSIILEYNRSICDKS